MHVSKIPKISCKETAWCFTAASVTATQIMLSAATKHLATLSMYFKIKDTNKPHIVNVPTVA